MIIILNSIFLAIGIALLIFDYFYIKDKQKTYENRLKRYINGGFELLGVGILISVLVFFDLGFEEFTIAKPIMIVGFVVASVFYTLILVEWYYLYKQIRSFIPEKILQEFKFKFRGIVIYGLVYCFSILFYIFHLSIRLG